MEIGKYKRLFSNVAIFSLGSILSRVILALMLPLYTRTLTQAEYGNAELLINITQIVIPFCTLAIHSAVFRFSMDEDFRHEDVFRTGLPVIGLSVVLFLISTFIIRITTSLSDYMVHYFFISFLSAVRSYVSLYTKACGKNILFSIDLIVYNTTLSLFNVLLLAVFKTGLPGYFHSLILANLCSVLLLVFGKRIYLDISHGRFNSLLIKKMLSYSIPVIFTDIAWGLISTTDKYMITDRLSESANGIYSVASKFSLVISLISGTFTEAWALSAIQDYGKEGESELYKNVFFIIHVILTGIILFLLAINNIFIPSFFGERFSEASKYTPLLLLGSYLTGYSLYYSALFSAAKKPSGIMISVLLGVFSNIILNYYLIPIFSVYGACIATIISSGVICIYRIVASRKIMKIDIEIKKWLLSIMLVSVVVVASIFRIHEVLISGICSLTLLFLYRKKIINIIRNITSKKSSIM